MSDSTKSNMSFKDLTIGASMSTLVERILENVNKLETERSEMRALVSEMKTLLKAIGPLFNQTDHPAGLKAFYDKELAVTTIEIANEEGRKNDAESRVKTLELEIEKWKTSLLESQHKATESMERLRELKREREELRKALNGKVMTTLNATEQRPGNTPIGSSEKPATSKAP